MLGDSNLPVYVDGKIALIREALTGNPDATFEISGITRAEYGMIKSRLERNLYSFEGSEDLPLTEPPRYTLQIRRQQQNA